MYVGTDQGTVEAFDAADGANSWRFDTGGEAPIFDDVSSSPAVVDGTVYVTGLTSNSASHLFAIEGQTR